MVDVQPEHKPLWSPNPDLEDGRPNPQRLAIESKAQEVFYGGAAGGGKTDLLLGLAFTRHRRSIIFRRIFPNLTAIIDRSVEIVGDDTNLNKSSNRWHIEGRTIAFGAMQYEGNKNKYQGQPHDFYGFDEITEFTRTQYLFVIGWNRTTIRGQRCRVVVAGNPPMDDAGSWVIEEWAPWLDVDFADPAEPGELRWYYRTGDTETGQLHWVKSGAPVKLEDGTVITPRSRTFIPAKLSDNPHLLHDPAYRSVLQSMPEPFRSALLDGSFTLRKQENPWQVIPAKWVREAQARWREQDSPEGPLSSAGIDCARGGRDKTALAKRYGDYFTVQSWPGVQTPDGPTAAALVVQALQNDDVPEWVNVDVIGIGSSVYDHLHGMYANWRQTGLPRNPINAVNVAGGSQFIDRKTGRFKMRNLRAEMYWRMRERLDPDLGSTVALPPGNEVLADLCAANYRLTASGVIVEDKESIIERIGRSPDLGEAIMLANLLPMIDKKQARVKAGHV